MRLLTIPLIVIFNLFISFSAMSQQGSDQNPNYRKSMGKYKQRNDSLLFKDTIGEEGLSESLNDSQIRDDNKGNKTNQIVKEIKEDLTAKDLYKEDYTQKIELYQRLKMYDKALESAKQFIAYNDSMMKEENRLKLEKLQEQFELEKKDQAIELLQREGELIELKSSYERKMNYFIVFGVVLFSGFVVLFYRRRQMRYKISLEKELEATKQKALHLQMNPHFIFNCLGSISSYIAQNDSEAAIKYLSKFSKLMRLTLEFSKASLIAVSKEIESLKHYIELEQLRFNGKFDFEIKSHQDIEDDMALAPMLIQPFVENAILHGMASKQEKGKIEIEFFVEKGRIICKIKDDGIGRKKSKQIKENSLPTHKSMAMDIIKKRLKTLHNENQKQGQAHIEDIYNEKKEIIGTIVTLDLPLQYLTNY